MIDKTNKNAGFCIRLFSTTIDIFIFCFLGIISSLICIEKKFIEPFNTNLYMVKNNFNYYLWLFLLILFLAIIYVLVPIFFNGRTIGMIIASTKIVFNSTFWNVLIKKMQIGVFLWIIIICLFMIFISPNIINKEITLVYITKNYDLKNIENNDVQILYQWSKWTTLESIRYAIPTSLPPFVIMFQLFLLISAGFKKNKVSFCDKLTLSQVVYKNKFELLEINEIKFIEPEKEKEIKIIWKE